MAINQAYPTLVIQENHYDPWGVAIEQEVVAYTSKLPRFELRDRFTYNGKELQGNLNYLDYGARMYDPSIGRWGVVDPLSEKWHMISSYIFALNDPLKFIDPDGNDVITGISNARVVSKNLYETRDATLKITLTVVNSANADLSKTMFNKNNGVIDATKIFGGNLSAKLNVKDVEINLNKVSIDYKVVDKIENARKGDNIMIIANDIPKLPNEDLNPAGRASLGGTTSAVEANTIADNTFNKTAYHELAHNLGIDDTYGKKGDGTKGLMGYSNNGSTSLSDTQKTQMIIAQGGAAYGNGTFSKQQSYPTYTQKAAAQFLKENKIKQSLMKHFIIFILSMVLIGCNRQKVNIEVDINDYNLLLPNNWSKINLNSPDAIIYAITDRIDTIIVHSGMNIGEFTDLQNLEESYDTLDSHIIQMIKPKTNDIGMWGLYLGGGTVKNKLSIIALIHNKENVFIAKEVFASLKIKTDCISICNEDVIGRIIYKRQCFNCHGDFNIGFGGVSLWNLTKSKNIYWIRNWIKSEGFRKSNKANSYESFEGLKDMNCSVTVMGIQEQESLVLYLKTHNKAVQ